MKIVISGAGQVGSHLAKMLVGRGHDLTVIDENHELLDDIVGISDVITVEGDPSAFSVLKKAAVRKADLFIAVHPEENVNIISAIIAKQLGAKKTIARIDNNEYLDTVNKEMFINIGIDYLFYPEKLAALEVVNLLRNTATSEYVDFSGGRMVLMVLRLDSASPLIEKTLAEVSGNPASLPYRTVAIDRDGRTIIPKGDDRFLEGDEIYIITERDSIRSATDLTGNREIEVRSVMIFGGSRIGIEIASELQDEADVKLIEYNQEKAYHLAEQLDQTLIINEDGRNIDAMLEEGLAQMDAFVAVTGRSETNILAAMFAKKMGVKKVIAEVENFNYINIAENIGIDTIINKKQITASNIFRFTAEGDLQSVKYLTGSDAEVLEYIVKPNSPATKRPIRELDFPDAAIIGGLVRGERVVIAVGDTQIEAFDRVVVFAKPGLSEKIGKYFI